MTRHRTTPITSRHLMAAGLLTAVAVSSLTFVSAAIAEERTHKTTTRTWTNLDRDGGWVYLHENSSFVNARERHLKQAKRARQGDEPLFLFILDNETWLIRNDALLADVKTILEPQVKIGEAQGLLGDAQGEIGEQQSKLGEAQSQIGEEQAELGRLQAQASQDRARQRSLADQQRALGDRQRELGNKQRELGKEQRRLGATQRELGAKQREMMTVVAVQLKELTQRAITENLAERLR